MYRMYSVYEVITQLRSCAVQIRANGGYVKSDVWLQIQADLFNKEVLVTEVAEASALGAAFLSMAAVGAVPDLKCLLPGMKPRRMISPVIANHEAYMNIYKKAKELYSNVYGETNTI